LKASERDGAVTVDIVVQPRASRASRGPGGGGSLRGAVTAPPGDGQANQAVVRALAEALGVPRAAVEIVRGETGRRKTIRIQGITLVKLLAAASP
jgi:uncharacterized protein (TIGR00251 family)